VNAFEVLTEAHRALLDEPLSRLKSRLEMLFKRTDVLLLVFLVAPQYPVMTGCVKPPEQPRVEQPPPPETVQPAAPATEPAQPEKALKLPTPTQADVRSAIARIYKDAVVVDANRFVVGDFNGDGSEDVAVVVKPATGALAEINSEVANWILEDPQKVVLPDPNKKVQPLAPLSKPTRVEQSDTLLAVIHGYGPSGWRDPKSRQTYLLKNAVGSNLKTHQLAGMLKASSSIAKLPKLRGDVINETIGEESGFIYYTGAKYAWYRRSPGGKSIASR
jgi:hypothetical protein